MSTILRLACASIAALLLVPLAAAGPVGDTADAALDTAQPVCDPLLACRVASGFARNATAAADAMVDAVSDAPASRIVATADEACFFPLVCEPLRGDAGFGAVRPCREEHMAPTTNLVGYIVWWSVQGGQLEPHPLFPAPVRDATALYPGADEASGGNVCHDRMSDAAALAATVDDALDG